MLGHIAIAAMGGCFSQHPTTGAAEATYFPTESVLLSGSIVFGNEFSRAAGTTDFVLGFTQTRFWVKMQRVTPGSGGLPFWFVLGTQSISFGPRNWCGMYGSSSVVYIANEKTTTLSREYNPTLVFTYTKEAGTDTSIAESDGISFGMATEKKEEALANDRFDFLGGPRSTAGLTRFFGDLCRNEPYGVSWHRVPMRSVESPAVALFEVDRKQLFEY